MQWRLQTLRPAGTYRYADLREAPGRQETNEMAASDWLLVDEVLAELRVTRSTWNKWRGRRVGPPMKRLPNGQLRIRRTDLDAWLDGQAAA